MKLYLGNSQDVEIDVDKEDIIYCSPIATACGGVTYRSERNAFCTKCWDGTSHSMKYFYFKTSQTRKECLSKEDAEIAAHAYYDDNNKNNSKTIVELYAKDINADVIKYFRYIQPIIEYPAGDVPIDPRFLGIWLGDGTATAPQITNVDKPIIDYIYKYTTQLDMKVTVYDKVGYSIVKKTGGTGANPLKEEMKNLNILSNKHIPEIYLANSKEVRLRVLGGLIDTDGYLDGNRYEIVQKSHTLAKDIVTLATSLGFFCRIIEKMACATNTLAKTKHLYYRVNIYPNYNSPIIPLLIEYKRLDIDSLKCINGIIMSLVKTKDSYRHEWTTMMKAAFEATVLKYTVKDKVQWKKMVSEELYKELTPDALRANNYTLNKQKKLVEAKDTVE
jgi:hypothetical protein